MRYVVLLLLNLPVILLAFVNLVAHYKMKKISPRRFRFQFIFWLIVLTILICSFPVYNYLSGRALLDSHELSLFDVVEVTAIVYLLYMVNDHRRKIEQNEKTLRDLHQELAIKLAQTKNGKS